LRRCRIELHGRWGFHKRLLYTRWRPWRRIHFWFSVVYSVTNVPHLLADILVPDARLDQIVLMVALTVFGLLINVEAWRWWRQGTARFDRST
jgi:hypothetical protein